MPTASPTPCAPTTPNGPQSCATPARAPSGPSSAAATSPTSPTTTAPPCTPEARTHRVPGLTPYTVDLLARSVVLDLSRARAQGWHPAHGLADYRA
ncbi:hypothetical protein [Kitasatospora brasiliensis]|uniref:hypothetical protein n=1 Tax=Kitasatospora brasiliensis TaxID=3058040 RepID=UPI00293010C2|nr:hypothetical protein [Kitasatospora sp. K002]